MGRWRAASDQQEDIDLVGELYEELISAQSPFRREGAERDKALPVDFRQRLAKLRDELTTLQKKPPPDIPRAVVVQEGGPPGTPHEGFHDAVVYLGAPHETRQVSGTWLPKVIGDEPPVIREGSGRGNTYWLADSKNLLRRGS
jgi:hypothetical protein